MLKLARHTTDLSKVEKTGEHRRPQKGEWYFCTFCKNVEEVIYPEACFIGDIYKLKEGVEI